MSLGTKLSECENGCFKYSVRIMRVKIASIKVHLWLLKWLWADIHTEKYGGLIKSLGTNCNYENFLKKIKQKFEFLLVCKDIYASDFKCLNPLKKLKSLKENYKI